MKIKLDESSAVTVDCIIAR